MTDLLVLVVIVLMGAAAIGRVWYESHELRQARRDDAAWREVRGA